MGHRQVFRTRANITLKTNKKNTYTFFKKLIEPKKIRKMSINNINMTLLLIFTEYF